jgi:hypothetical protein
MKRWLFYAGPENYLSNQGERDFTNAQGTWSSSREVRPGDLVLLYRKTLTKTSAADMVHLTGMSLDTAEALRRRGIGSDIADVWQAVSGPLGPFGRWLNGCEIKHLAKIDPPIRLSDLKAVPQLRKWDDLRWNFQSKGRDAEIPDFAWERVSKMIEERVGRRIADLAAR